MKWPFAIIVAALVAYPGVAMATNLEAGVEDAGALDAGVDAEAPVARDPNNPPVACDGGLCDTTNGSTCSMSRAPSAPIVLIAVAVLPLAALVRRRRR